MKTSNRYYFIYRVSEEEKTGKVNASSIVGYGFEVPKPDEEHPHEWEVLSVDNLIGPDEPWGDTWVAAKKDITRCTNSYMKMEAWETMDDFFEYNPNEVFYPTPVNVNMIVTKMKELAEDDWQKEMADHFSEVITDDEWQSDTKEFDMSKMMSFDTIMERLQEKYGE